MNKENNTIWLGVGKKKPSGFLKVKKFFHIHALLMQIGSQWGMNDDLFQNLYAKLNYILNWDIFLLSIITWDFSTWAFPAQGYCKKRN